MSIPGAAGPDHYQTLGVAPDAEIAVIKSRYRALVREHHPDIAADKIAATGRMVIILEAWRVLSDPLERERYDRDCRERARRAAAAATPTPAPHRRTAGSSARPANGANHPAPARSGAARPPASKPPASARQTGSTPATATGKPAGASKSGASKSGAARSASSASSKAQAAAQRNQFIEKTVETARRSLADGNTDEAIAICRWVLKVEPKSAAAAALLGDIFAQQGQRDMAMMMYGRASLNQPANPVYRWKLDNLRRPATAHNAAPTPPPVREAAKTNAPSAPPTTTIYINANTPPAKQNPRRSRLGCAGPALLLLAVGGALLAPLWMVLGAALG